FAVADASTSPVAAALVADIIRRHGFFGYKRRYASGERAPLACLRSHPRDRELYPTEIIVSIDTASLEFAMHEQNGKIVRQAHGRTQRRELFLRRSLHVADETRLHHAQNERQPHHFSAWIKLPEFAAVCRREGEG